MGRIKLNSSANNTSTIVSNRFLDEYMPNANGEFVKVYLFLLRALSSPDNDISVCRIADILNHTEKDVIRALKYWEQAGLLDLTFDSEKTLSGITFKPVLSDYITSDGTSIELNSEVTSGLRSASSITHIYTGANKSSGSIPEKLEKAKPAKTVIEPEKPVKKSYTADELDAFKAKEDVEEFLYLAQKYIGKTLSGTDVNSLLFIYDVLGFESDLIEYLIEYCVTNGHKSVRYMEKVAISWADEGISDVKTAKANTSLYSKSCYPVLKAFGLNGRNPGEGEKALIIKWTNTFGFSMDIILDACNRTMNTIHQPSFEYADSILTKWNQKGIHTLSDLKVLDDEHQKNKSLHPNKNLSSLDANNTNNANNKQKNTFNDFTQRTYNYEALEKELLGNI